MKESAPGSGVGMRPEDADLQNAILALLEQRAPSTICTSDVARAVGTADGWRDLMQPVRDAAARLADRGEVEVTQKGEPVDVRTARGPVRIRRPGNP